MKLYIVHAGYYDDEIGIYELHTNFIVAASDLHEVKKKVREIAIFKQKNMHIDAVQEVDMVDGYKVTLVKALSSVSVLPTYDYSQMKNIQ